jgi:hypothetical protein
MIFDLTFFVILNKKLLLITDWLFTLLISIGIINFGLFNLIRVTLFITLFLIGVAVTDLWLRFVFWVY